MINDVKKSLLKDPPSERLPLVTPEYTLAGEGLSLFDQDRCLHQTPHLIPVGQGLGGGRGQPDSLSVNQQIATVTNTSLYNQSKSGKINQHRRKLLHK